MSNLIAPFDAFAKALNLPTDTVSDALTNVLGSDQSIWVELVQSEHVRPEDVAKELADSKPRALVLRAYQTLLTSCQPVPPPIPNYNFPTVPTNEELFQKIAHMPKLYVGEEVILCGIRSILAHNTNLLEAPKAILNLISKVAERKDQSIPDAYWVVKQSVGKTAYADIFASMAVRPEPGTFATEAQERALFESMRNRFIPAIRSFWNTVDQWHRNWMSQANASSALSMAFSGSNGPLGTLVNQAVQPPPVAPVMARVDQVVGEINKTFAVFTGYTAIAVAQKATQVSDLLQRPDLSDLIGAETPEMVTNLLNLSNMNRTIVDTERALSSFVLCLLALNGLTEEERVVYLSHMHTLGSTIDWGLVS